MIRAIAWAILIVAALAAFGFSAWAITARDPDGIAFVAFLALILISVAIGIVTTPRGGTGPR